MSQTTGPASGLRTLAVNLGVCACAAGAGIHAGLVPEHLREEPRLGVAFLVTVAVLVAVGAMLALRPDRVIATVAALVLGGLIFAYVASRTTGIPMLADQEAVDPVGIAAVVIELLGMTCALCLAQPIRRPRRPSLQEVPR